MKMREILGEKDEELMRSRECIWDVRFEICISREGGGTKAFGCALWISGLIGAAGDLNFGIVSVKFQCRKQTTLDIFIRKRFHTELGIYRITRGLKE